MALGFLLVPCGDCDCDCDSMPLETVALCPCGSLGMPPVPDLGPLAVACNLGVEEELPEMKSSLTFTAPGLCHNMHRNGIRVIILYISLELVSN